MSRLLGWLAWLIVAYLLTAAVFELVLALQHATSPQGEGWILLATLLTMLAGAALVFRSIGLAGLFAPSAALFVVARFYTGDPYYRPTFRAYGDGGVVSPVWVFALLGLALVAGAATQFWRRPAQVANAAVLLVLALTALLMGTGH